VAKAFQPHHGTSVVGIIFEDALQRLHERKRAVTIVDDVDVLVPMLTRMHQKRLRGYAAIGYSVAAP
jgi:hypothetical protein